MLRFFRWIAIGLGALVVVLIGIAMAARLSDGPIGDGPIAAFPGGKFQSGTWVEDEVVDFTFATEIQEVELQSAGRSRTTWILVLDGNAYIPVGLGFPPGKRWHKEALEDPTAVLRVEGRRYRRTLVRVDDEAMRRRLGEVGLAKYGPGPAGGDLSGIWFFHLAPPAA